MSLSAISFKSEFRELTGFEPFPWQERLFEELRGGCFPKTCRIPTGLGKTSIMAVWAIALAHDGEHRIPRRLVYVVNRRTVVDQATREAEKLRENLHKSAHSDLADRLRKLCAIEAGTPAPSGNQLPLAISTLRGQFADNGEWCADPARPAIIVGTVDMIGSRLLFSAYRRGFRSRPMHAGFLGQDVLLIHDEAHLEPAFQALIETIQKEQRKTQDFGVFRLMALSATSRDDASDRCGEKEAEPFELTHEERDPPDIIPDQLTEPIHYVWRRIKARKAINLTQNKIRKELGDDIAALALERFKDSGRTVLVFVRMIDDVKKVVDKLEKDEQQVQQLTGTLRGLERDGLVKKPIFQRFVPESNRDEHVTPAEGTVYLVCTSAGEVGIDISADHLVCDLSTFESMAQRLGRVNRFGNRDDSEIHVFYPSEFDEKKDIEVRLQETLVLLKQLKGDGSSLALSRLAPDARASAFAPVPTVLPATDILFDAWAMTSIRKKLPGRPPIAPYLHGISSWEPPETHVAWREEVGVITGDLLDKHNPEDLIEDYPLKPHELLRDRSERVFNHLLALAADPKSTAKLNADERQRAQRKAESNRSTPVWLVSRDGSVVNLTLGELVEAGSKDRINHRTVLLSPKVGGLKNGLLNGNSKTAEDVADEWFCDIDEKARRRVRVWNDDPQFDEKTKGMRLIRHPIDIRPDADEIDEEEGNSTVRRLWHWYELPDAGDSEGSRWSNKPVLWQVHTDDVSKIATAIADKLLTGDMKQALILAAKYHDLGKQRAIFQRILGNHTSELVLSKSGKKHRGIPEHYRHEFGSLLDLLHSCTGAPQAEEFANLSPELQDLVLHLVAAHHGRARPHFSLNEAFDPERTTQQSHIAAIEVPRRFARLQRKYGRWGLAYLESLLRAADWAASAEPSEFITEDREVLR